MKVRIAHSGDAPAIAAIWNPVIRTSAATFNAVEKSASDIALMITERQAQGHGFWVAQDDTQTLGFVTYAQFRAGQGYAHTMEHTVVLSDQARGRGVGRLLLETAEQHARTAGHHSMFAGVSGENTDGIAFHTRMGFETIALLPQVGRKFDRWHDLVLMQKPL